MVKHYIERFINTNLKENLASPISRDIVDDTHSLISPEINSFSPPTQPFAGPSDKNPCDPDALRDAYSFWLLQTILSNDDISPSKTEIFKKFVALNSKNAEKDRVSNYLSDFDVSNSTGWRAQRMFRQLRKENSFEILKRITTPTCYDSQKQLKPVESRNNNNNTEDKLSLDFFVMSSLPIIKAISQLEKATNVKTSLNTEITKMIQNVLTRDDFSIHETFLPSTRHFIAATAQILKEILQIDAAFSHIVATTSNPKEILPLPNLFSDPKSDALSSCSSFPPSETPETTKSPTKKLKTSFVPDIFSHFISENSETLLTRVLISLHRRNLSEICIALYPLFYLWLKPGPSLRTDWLNHPIGVLTIKKLSEYMAHEIDFEFGKKHLKVEESVGLPEKSGFGVKEGDPFGGFFETDGQRLGDTLYGQVACDGDFCYVYRDGEMAKVCLGPGVGPRGEEKARRAVMLARGWMFLFKKRLFYRQVEFGCPEDMCLELDRDSFEIIGLYKKRAADTKQIDFQMTSNSDYIISLSFDLKKKFFLNFYQFDDDNPNESDRTEFAEKKIYFDEKLNPYRDKNANFEREINLKLKVRHLKMVKSVRIDGMSLQLPFNVRGHKKVDFGGKVHFFDTREINEFDQGDKVAVNLSQNSFKWETGTVLEVSDACIKVSVTDDKGDIKFEEWIGKQSPRVSNNSKRKNPYAFETEITPQWAFYTKSRGWKKMTLFEAAMFEKCYKPDLFSKINRKMRKLVLNIDFQKMTAVDSNTGKKFELKRTEYGPLNSPKISFIDEVILVASAAHVGFVFPNWNFYGSETPTTAKFFDIDLIFKTGAALMTGVCAFDKDPTVITDMTFDPKNNQFVQYDRNNHQLLFYTNPALGVLPSFVRAAAADLRRNKPFVLYLLEFLSQVSQKYQYLVHQPISVKRSIDFFYSENSESLLILTQILTNCYYSLETCKDKQNLFRIISLSAEILGNNLKVKIQAKKQQFSETGFLRRIEKIACKLLLKTPEIPDFVVVSLLTLLERSDGVLATQTGTLFQLIDRFIASPSRSIFLSKLAKILIKSKTMQIAPVLIDLARKCFDFAKNNCDYGIFDVFGQIYHSFHLFCCEKVKPFLCAVFFEKMIELLESVQERDSFERRCEEFRGVFDVVSDYLHESPGMFGRINLKVVVDFFCLVSGMNKDSYNNSKTAIEGYTNKNKPIFQFIRQIHLFDLERLDRKYTFPEHRSLLVEIIKTTENLNGCSIEFSAANITRTMKFPKTPRSGFVFLPSNYFVVIYLSDDEKSDERIDFIINIYGVNRGDKYITEPMGTMLEMQFRLAETISVAYQPIFHFDIDEDFNDMNNTVLDLSIFTKETLNYIEENKDIKDPKRENFGNFSKIFLNSFEKSEKSLNLPSCPPYINQTSFTKLKHALLTTVLYYCNFPAEPEKIQKTSQNPFFIRKLYKTTINKISALLSKFLQLEVNERVLSNSLDHFVPFPNQTCNDRKIILRKMTENINIVPEPDRGLMLLALNAKYMQHGAKSMTELLADRMEKKTALFLEPFGEEGTGKESFVNAVLAFFANWAFAKVDDVVDVMLKRIAVCKRNDFVLGQIAKSIDHSGYNPTLTHILLCSLKGGCTLEFLNHQNHYDRTGLFALSEAMYRQIESHSRDDNVLVPQSLCFAKMCDFVAMVSAKNGFEFKGKEGVFGVLATVFDAICVAFEKLMRKRVEIGGVFESKTVDLRFIQLKESIFKLAEAILLSAIYRCNDNEASGDEMRGFKKILKMFVSKLVCCVVEFNKSGVENKLNPNPKFQTEKIQCILRLILIAISLPKNDKIIRKIFWIDSVRENLLCLIYSPGSTKIDKKHISKIIFEVVSFGISKQYWTVSQHEIELLCTFLGKKTIENHIFPSETPKTVTQRQPKTRIAKPDFWALSITTVTKKPSPETALFSTSNELVTFSKSLENFFDDSTHIFESVIRAYGPSDFYRYKHRKSGPFLGLRTLENQISEDIKSGGKADFFYGDFKEAMKTAEKLAGHGYSTLLRKVQTNDYMRKNQRELISFSEYVRGPDFEWEIEPGFVNSVLVFLKNAVHSDLRLFGFFENVLTEWAKNASAVDEISEQTELRENFNLCVGIIMTLGKKVASDLWVQNENDIDNYKLCSVVVNEIHDKNLILVGKNAEISVSMRCKTRKLSPKPFRLSKETIDALIGLIKKHYERVVIGSAGNKNDVLLFAEIFELLSFQTEINEIARFLALMPVLVNVVEKKGVLENSNKIAKEIIQSEKALKNLFLKKSRAEKKPIKPKKAEKQESERKKAKVPKNQLAVDYSFSPMNPFCVFMNGFTYAKHIGKNCAKMTEDTAEQPPLTLISAAPITDKTYFEIKIKTPTRPGAPSSDAAPKQGPPLFAVGLCPDTLPSDAAQPLGFTAGALALFSDGRVAEHIAGQFAFKPFNNGPLTENGPMEDLNGKGDTSGGDMWDEVRDGATRAVVGCLVLSGAVYFSVGGGPVAKAFQSEAIGEMVRARRFRAAVAVGRGTEVVVNFGRETFECRDPFKPAKDALFGDCRRERETPPRPPPPPHSRTERPTEAAPPPDAEPLNLARIQITSRGSLFRAFEQLLALIAQSNLANVQRIVSASGFFPEPGAAAHLSPGQAASPYNAEGFGLSLGNAGALQPLTVRIDFESVSRRSPLGAASSVLVISPKRLIAKPSDIFFFNIGNYVKIKRSVKRAVMRSLTSKKMVKSDFFWPTQVKSLIGKVGVVREFDYKNSLVLIQFDDLKRNAEIDQFWVPFSSVKPKSATQRFSRERSVDKLNAKHIRLLQSQMAKQAEKMAFDISSFSGGGEGRIDRLIIDRFAGAERHIREKIDFFADFKLESLLKRGGSCFDQLAPLALCGDEELTDKIHRCLLEASSHLADSAPRAKLSFSCAEIRPQGSPCALFGGKCYVIWKEKMRIDQASVYCVNQVGELKLPLNTFLIFSADKNREKILHIAPPSRFLPPLRLQTAQLHIFCVLMVGQQRPGGDPPGAKDVRINLSFSSPPPALLNGLSLLAALARRKWAVAGANRLLPLLSAICDLPNVSPLIRTEVWGVVAFLAMTAEGEVQYAPFEKYFDVLENALEDERCEEPPYEAHSAHTMALYEALLVLLVRSLRQSSSPVLDSLANENFFNDCFDRVLPQSETRMPVELSPAAMMVFEVLNGIAPGIALVDFLRLEPEQIQAARQPQFERLKAIKRGISLVARTLRVRGDELSMKQIKDQKPLWLPTPRRDHIDDDETKPRTDNRSQTDKENEDDAVAEARFVWCLNKSLPPLFPTLNMAGGFLRRVLRPVKALLFAEPKAQFCDEVLRITAQSACEEVVVVRRMADGAASVFEQLYAALKKAPIDNFRIMPSSIKSEEVAFKVTFENEAALGNNGPYREALENAFADLFRARNPKPVFEPSANFAHRVGDDRFLFVPAPHAPWRQRRLRFAGRLMAMAFRSKALVSLFFPRLLYCLLAGDRPGRGELDQIDHSFCRSLLEFFENITSEEEFAAANVALRFDSLTAPFAAESLRGAAVTFETRLDYVRAAEKAKIRYFCESFGPMTEGFFEIVPKAAIALFTAAELERALCGAQTPDLALLRAHTVYKSCSAADDFVGFFWGALEALSPAELERFVEFAYASRRLPASAADFTARGLRMQLQPLMGGDDCFPRAETCFFNVSVPRYSSTETALRMLRRALALDWGMSGDDAAELAVAAEQNAARRSRSPTGSIEEGLGYSTMVVHMHIETEEQQRERMAAADDDSDQTADDGASDDASDGAAQRPPNSPPADDR